MTLLRTGVGSLPHVDTEAAIRFVTASTDIPYLPQLPNRHPEESMLVQWGDGMLGAGPSDTVLSAGAARGDSAQAFVGAGEMLGAISGGTVKTQATGPVTLAAALRAGGVYQPKLIGAVTDRLAARIADHLDWIRANSDVAEVILVLDEPALAALGPGGRELPVEAAEALTRLIDEFDVPVGIHCCGDTDWGGVADLGFQWLSWDLGALGSGFQAGLDRIAQALGRGTRVMWGIVPTTTGPLPSRNVILGRYGTAVASLVVAGAPFAALKGEALFTPACGLAGLSIDDAEAVAQLLQEVVGEVESGW